MSILRSLFDFEYKELRRFMKIADQIEAKSDEYEKLTDKQLQHKTEEFKKELEKGKTLDDILVDAFATVREAAKRVINEKPFYTQVLGALAIHYGNIAEMKTGEGKTLTSVMPAYLNALTGEGVHIITVNEYLASRDAAWMGQIFEFLGLTVGTNLRDLSPAEKRERYNCDILYSTNNEIGFDYLRDNMVVRKEDRVQRPLNFAIVDEVDSVLIDEARTPLIISGGAMHSNNQYMDAQRFVRDLKENEDFIIDEKTKSINLTDEGSKKCEKFYGIDNMYDIKYSALVHHINQALRANFTMKNEVDYVVQDGKVVIVDQFTGRLMQGRAFSEGLHQAIEAKEGVKINEETKTLATITFQNLFRMYKKLSGMTGTAMTEESEFQEIYHLDVVSIPTNKPMIRKDTSDIIYKNEKAKFRAVVQDVKESYEKGQPVLIGTVSIEKSEKLSKILTKEGIKHQVLNAKAHEREAEIIAQAGKYGAVTIATNMAGRGTDIMLGGNSEYLAKQEMKRMKYASEMIEQATAFNETEDQDIINARKKFRELVKKYEKEIEEEKQKVVEAGGLKIIGTERHESRRIDNQLRGRSGRQGDPGCSRFYIGLDDNLMKIFGGDAITKVYDKLNASEDLPIESRIITNAVENAQKRVEGRNFSIRKNVLKYDDVMNAQRELIYRQRREVLDGKDLKDNIEKMFNSIVDNVVSTHFSVADNEKVNKEALMQDITDVFGITELESVKKENPDVVEVSEELAKVVSDKYAEKEKDFGEKEIRELERVVVLKVVDQKWMDHIDNMEELKNGIGLRAYGQKDPVVQYRIEGTDMFDEMNENIRLDVVKILSHVEKVGNVVRTSNVKVTNEGFDESAISLVEGKLSQSDKNHVQQTIVNDGPKVGRNDPCPCGSGKKYKNCCGRNQ